MRACIRVLIASSAIAVAAPVGGAFAQATDNAAIARRLEALETSQKAIQKQLEEIKALLTARPPAPAPAAAPAPVESIAGTEVSLANTAVKGQAGAKFALIEYSDFQCPFCGRYARESYGQLQKEFVDTGKLKYAFKHLPLEGIHPFAFKAAEAGECARDQGKFWEMHDQMFANQTALAQPNLLQYAQGLGLDAGKFQACLDGKTAAHVREDSAEAQKLGAGSTPTFFIGQVQPDGKVKLLRKITGAQPYATFRAALQGLLAAPPPAK
jgi:protein-disulfide isomerase